MTTSVVTTTPRTQASDAALVIALRDITALPVLDNERLVGMFTEQDLLRVKRPGPQAAVLVGDVMSPAALTTTPDHDAVELAQLMRQRGIRSVPVLDGSRLVGIITATDVGHLAPAGG